MNKFKLVAIVTGVALVVSPLLIAAPSVYQDYLLDQYQSAKDERALMALDGRGDRDGEGEFQTLPDRTQISEESLYWECYKMGNKQC